MRFKSKPVEIEAWREGCGEPIPGWVYILMRDNQVILTHHPRILPQVFNAKHGTWIQFSHDTDWLIYNGPDDIYPCDEETFERKYEVVKCGK